jgi:hypothetical protein
MAFFGIIRANSFTGFYPPPFYAIMTKILLFAKGASKMTQDQITHLCEETSETVRREIESQMFTWQLDLVTGDAAEASYKVMQRYIKEFVVLSLSKVLGAIYAEKK